MYNCYFQRWENFIENHGVRGSGCSLHIDIFNYERFIDLIYSKRNSIKLKEYDRILGTLLPCSISNILLEEVISKSGSLRLSEYQMNNLFRLEELSF